MPVSLTTKWMCTSSSLSFPRSAVTSTSPCSVNLMALPTRLSSTCRNRPGSPTRVSGTSGRIRQASSSPFSCARGATIRRASATVSRSPNSIASSSSLRASIFEKSRMSLITESRESAASFTEPMSSRWCVVRRVLRARSVMPITAFIGVRISWLMLARNCPFAAVASSARRLATSSSRTSCVSRAALSICARSASSSSRA